MNLAATMSLATGGFTNPLAGARAALGNFTASLASAISPLAVFTAGLAGMAAAGGVAFKAVSAAADQETLTAKLTVVTKNAQVATSVLAELNKFSDITPFEPEPIMKAGVALLGAKFAAADLKGLLGDLGDLASAGMGDMSENLNEVVNAMGRMKSGQFGEAFEMLRRFSISSQDLMAKGLTFDKGGQFVGSAEQAITAVRSVIKDRFGGTMEVMSQTTQGLFSTLKGNLTAMFRELGTPLLGPIRDALQSMLTMSDGLKVKAGEWGKEIASVVQIGVGIFKNGEMGNAVGLSLKIGMGEGVNFIMREMTGIAAALQEALGQGMAVLMSGDLWGFIGASLKAAFSGLEVVLLTIFQNAIAALQAGVENVMATVTGKDPRRDAARAQQNGAQEEVGMFGKAMNREYEKNGFSDKYRELWDLKGKKENERDSYANMASGKATVADRADAILKSGELGEVKSEYAQKAGEELVKAKESLRALLSSGLVDGGKIKGAYSDAKAGAGDAVNTSGYRNALAELISDVDAKTKKLHKILTDNVPSTPAKASDEALPDGTRKASSLMEGDRLSKIGLFIGGGGPANEHARRTAENTTKLVSLFQKKQGPRPATGFTAWA